MLLDQGVHFENETTKINHPLVQAIREAISKDHISILKLLLTKSYGINVEDGEGRTPLFWAIDSRHENMINLLLDWGANIELKDKYGCTPLMYATFQGPYLSNVKTLLDRGADIDAKNIECSSPLSIIKKYPAFLHLLKKNLLGLKLDS
ncbi:uncharacterized protein EAE97_004075 [Botrytis byssoidea]|uniref:Ankyrin repeat protein n=1 Tax=Botrytis byssoidea TaxID=139641 RepID=A0A9P5IS84_9HELO|nr:uncharacterized protein EAE97_004075 [Botrytis byssoidea]KAF7946826.1 hypothetical protein EAE97_004075 [Botrytis byssoidea]